MQAYLTLTRRELAGYFLSMTGYVVLAAVTLLLGWSFVDLLVNLQQQPTPMPITELFFVTQFFWLILVLSAPVLTMRLFALEKFSGTFETLMTTPVSELQVVLAKFSAGLILYIVTWLPLLGCLSVVRYYANAPAALNAGVVASTFLGIILLGCVFISWGCLASSLTRSQVTAAMISLAFGVCLFLVGVLATHVPAYTTWQTEVLAALSFFEQMHDFARGVVDTRAVILYLSLTLLFLFMTLRVVESRRWK
ncbi:MAG TPA: ABC transporter permease [Candidatus Acidoferrum sp.]|jgi:ABC-2 type transport system permease protein|nr:ABC transporter permease [Candidatus Acidoferrum sp.]